VASFADYFVISTGNSERHLRAIQREVVELAKGLSLRPLHSEGTGTSGWILLDYGPLIVHLFLADLRRHYDLEGFWKDGRTMLRLL
jgi:ribosome-associated protein